MFIRLSVRLSVVVVASQVTGNYHYFINTNKQPLVTEDLEIAVVGE